METDLFRPTERLRWKKTVQTVNGVDMNIALDLQQLWVNCNTEEEQWRDVPTE